MCILYVTFSNSNALIFKPMKNLLYIGNKLSEHGFNQTSIETLGVFLAEEAFVVTYTSDKKNQIIRLYDMIKTTVLKAKKVDFILIDTYSTSSFWFAFFCSQIARVLKTKYIPILRGGDLPNLLEKRPYFCKLVFNNSYKNVAPSNYLLEKFKKNGFENVIFIPNSIPLENYNFKQRINIKPRLLWVRAFAKIYNPKMAIDVFKLLKQNHPEAKLTMIGPDKDGSLITTKKYAESLDLEVEFTGKISKKEWIELSNEHYIFINTTHFDNTPISVIEAMALGLPVVSTNVGGIPYMLTNYKNALLVNDNQSNEMLLAIEKLLADDVLVKNLTKEARNLADSMDWKVIKLKWKEILLQ